MCLSRTNLLGSTFGEERSAAHKWLDAAFLDLFATCSRSPVPTGGMERMGVQSHMANEIWNRQMLRSLEILLNGFYREVGGPVGRVSVASEASRRSHSHSGQSIIYWGGWHTRRISPAVPYSTLTQPCSRLPVVQQDMP